MTSYDALAIGWFRICEIEVARSWPRDHVTANPNPNVDVARGAWHRGHTTALDQSQCQHCIAKGVASTGASIVIVILGVIKCKVAPFPGIFSY